MKSVVFATLVVIAGAALIGAPPAHASGLSATSAKDAQDNITRAIDEQRLTDASLLLDHALINAPSDPLLQILSGDLELARQHPAEALAQYRSAEATPSVQARALEGEGLALAALGRFDEAQPVLQRATVADAKAWRAWNALGATYDETQKWSAAEDAYAHALTASNGAAIVLNNRGYSRLLQSRYDEAATDFMAALRRKPDLMTARTNLRFVMALRGEYDRAIAGAGAPERAALLNNAGFAAALRGDYARADQLLTQAAAAKGEYYARAAGNLQFTHDLAARGPAPTPAPAPAVTKPAAAAAGKTASSAGPAKAPPPELAAQIRGML